MWVYRRPHFRRRYARNVLSVVTPPANSWIHAHIKRVTSRERSLLEWQRPFRPAQTVKPRPVRPKEVPGFLAAHIRRMVSRDRREPDWVRPFKVTLPLLGVAVTTPSHEYLAAHIRRMTSRLGRWEPDYFRRYRGKYPLLGVSDIIVVYLTGRGHVVGGGTTAGLVRSGGATRGQVTGGGATAGKVK